MDKQLFFFRVKLKIYAERRVFFRVKTCIFRKCVFYLCQQVEKA